MAAFGGIPGAGPTAAVPRRETLNRHAEHQADVLQRLAGCALAEVVEPRHQHGLAVLGVSEDPELEGIAAVEALGFEALTRARRVTRGQDRDARGPGIIR